MTRSSKVALVTLLVGLLSLASVGTVGARTPCTGVAREQCEQSVADQAVTFHIAVASQTVAVPYLGVAREQYEANMVLGTVSADVASVAAPRRWRLPTFIGSCQHQSGK